MMTAGARHVFHNGLVPLLTDEELWLLRAWLISKPEQFIQGDIIPRVEAICDYERVSSGCLFANVGRIRGLSSARPVSDFFGGLCYEIDNLTGEPASVRYLLNWYDEKPWEMVREDLILELNEAMQARKEKQEEQQLTENEIVF